MVISMKNRMKKILFFFCTLLFVLGLAACGKKVETQSKLTVEEIEFQTQLLVNPRRVRKHIGHGSRRGRAGYQAAVFTIWILISSGWSRVSVSSGIYDDSKEGNGRNQ